MKREDYNKLRDTTELDRKKNGLLRCAEGLTLLAKLGGKTMAVDHDAIYAGGPDMIDLSKEDAKTLCELGWNDYGDDMGFTYFP